MSDPTADPIEAFADTVLGNLHKHGFPAQKVAFPLERLYESAYAKGVNFNKVLEVLAARGVDHEKTPERVIFAPRAEPDARPVAPGFDPASLAGLDPSVFAGLDPAALAGQGPEAMMAMAQQLLARLDPAQLAAMKAMVDGLSDEEKAALLARGRDFGLG